MNRNELVFRLAVLGAGVGLVYGGFNFLAGLLLIGSLVGYVRR